MRRDRLKFYRVSIVWALVFSVSLSFPAANIWARSPVETSSPEENNKVSLPGFDPISFGLRSDPSPTESHFSNPLLTDGIFPYQSNFYAALVAAGITLAYMTWKETGKVDVGGFIDLLNSTDFYAGYVGSITGKGGQWVGAKGITKLLEKAPASLQPSLTSSTALLLGNIVNGFTQVLSISAGFEICSQFWKISTKNIPEAHTVTGFLAASKAKKIQAVMSLVNNALLDKNMQKRIVQSVWNYRILTFEFISMNVALYSGMILGNWLVTKYGSAYPWLKKWGAIGGGVTLGILTEMLVPDSWNKHANAKLVRWKLGNARHDLDELFEEIRKGILEERYPSFSRKGTRSYWMSGVDLQSDMERIFRLTRLVSVLQFQEMFYREEQSLMAALPNSALSTDAQMGRILNEINRANEASLEAQVAQWVAERRSPEEIQYLSAHYRTTSPKREYYALVMDAAKAQSEEMVQEVEQLLDSQN